MNLSVISVFVLYVRHPLYSDKDYVELILFLVKCLVDLASETIWAWIFLSGEFFNYKFSVFNSYRIIEMIYSILGKFL